MIIDFHTHIFPQHLAERSIKQLSTAAKLTPTTNGTLDDLRETSKDAGIDICVVQNIATNAKQTINVNNFAISQLDEEGIIPFGSIHPDFEDWLEELKRLKVAGIKGIKLHPDYQVFFVDENRMFPIYEAIRDLGLILQFHSGLDIGLPGDIHCTPDRVAKILAEVPGQKLVAAHFGANEMWDDVLQLLAGKDVYIDTSFAARRMNKDLLLKIIDKHGSEKILFGSDSPWSDAKLDVELFKTLPINDHEKEGILSHSAQKLLNI